MKERPTRGFLDYVDISLGRVSDSDSSDPGKRKRSWGATVMLFCMIPAFTLVFAVAFNIIVASLSIQHTAKKATVTSKAKVKSRRSSSRSLVSFPKPVSIEWPIVTLASLILVVGVCFSLFRRKQDLDRAIQLGKMVTEVKHGFEEGAEAVPSKVKGMLEAATKKIGVSFPEGDKH